MLVLPLYTFPSFPCNYMQLTDIQYQNLKWSSSNPLKYRNPWTKRDGNVRIREYSRRVQENFPHTSSSPLPGCGGLARQKKGSIQLMPAFLQVLRIHCFPLCLSLEGMFKKKKKKKRKKKRNKDTKKISGEDLVNKFSPVVRLKQTFMLPSKY